MISILLIFCLEAHFYRRQYCGFVIFGEDMLSCLFCFMFYVYLKNMSLYVCPCVSVCEWIFIWLPIDVTRGICVSRSWNCR